MGFRCQRIQCTLMQELHQFQMSAFHSTLLLLSLNLEKKPVCGSISAAPVFLILCYRVKSTYSIKAYYSSILLVVVAYYFNSVKVFSVMGRGLFQNFLILSCHLAPSTKWTLQNYTCLRFVYQGKKRNLQSIPGIEVIVHQQLSGGFP